MSAISPATRARVYARDNHVCVRCWNGRDLSVHHRRPRGMGGSRRGDTNGLANLITLCGDGTRGCHGWVEAHRAEASRLGFLCPSWEDPADWPVLRGHAWEQPGEEWTPAEPLSVQTLSARCHCGRPVPASSSCQCCCAEHES